MLRHRKCGGNLLLDITNVVKILTPAYALTLDGINMGTVEFTKSNLPDGVNDAQLICGRCGGVHKSDSLEVEAQCGVCRKFKTTEKLLITKELPCVCTECYAGIISKEESPSGVINEFRSFIRIDQNMVKKTVLSVLCSKINI